MSAMSNGQRVVIAWSRGEAIGQVAAATGTTVMEWEASRTKDGPRGEHRWFVTPRRTRPAFPW